jgi:hypothetical protein
MKHSAALIALLLSCASAPARADDGGSPTPAASERGGLPQALTPKVNSKLSKSAIAVGEIATLTIEVDAPSSVEVSLPEQSLGGLELADRRMRSEVAGGRTRTTYELDLLALAAADVELPPLLLRLVGPNGELGSARTESKDLRVSSLIANEPNAEPKPPTKPLAVMRDDYTLAWIGGGIVAAGLIALATLLIARWARRRPKPVAPPPPPRPAWELALERLQALQREKDHLFAEQRGELFIDGVSDALREYLGRRYGFDGLERTTSELMTTLEQLRPNKLSLSGVSLLLEQCDLVKFARATPDTEQADDLWNGALGLVRATTPSPSELPPPVLPQREAAR